MTEPERLPIAGCCVDIDGGAWHDVADCPNQPGSDWYELLRDIEHTRRTGEVHRPGGLT
jgi:hypothetical protein